MSDASELLPMGFSFRHGQVELFHPGEYLALRPPPFWGDFLRRSAETARTGASGIDSYKDLFLPLYEELRSQPSLHVFMVNRCGSTLLLNMLSHHPRLACFNELTPWMSHSDLLLGIEPDDDLNRAVGTHLASWSEVDGRTILLKYPAEVTRFARSLVELFPASRSIFLCRHYEAVIGSLLRDPPNAFPGEPLFRLEETAPTLRRWAPELRVTTLAATFLDTMAAYRTAATSEAGRRGLRCLRYESLLADPRACIERCLQFFELPADEALVTRMLAEVEFDAKPRAGGVQRRFTTRAAEAPLAALPAAFRAELEASWREELPGDLMGG